MLAERTRSYGSGEANAWLLKLDEAGQLADCSIDEAGSPVLQEFSLSVSTPAVTAVSLDWTLSSGDLVTNDDTITRTEVCEAKVVGDYGSSQSCQ